MNSKTELGPMKALSIQDLNDLHAAGKLAGRIFHPYEISNDVYHGFGSPGVSRSGLALCLLCPQEFQEKHLGPQEERTEEKRIALIIGNASHTIVLEPKRFTQQYVSDFDIIQQVIDENPDVKSPRGTKRFKELRADLIASSEGLTVLKSKEYDDVYKLVDIINTNDLARSMLTGGKAEHTLYWIDDATGVLCKDRIDLIRDDLDRPKIVEFKTIANIHKFRGHIGEHHYDMQAVIHFEAVHRVLKIKAPTVFVVRQKESRVIRFGQLSNRFLDIGHRKWRKSLDIYARCMKDSMWPGFPQEVEDMDPEVWYEKRMMEELTYE